MCERVCGQGVCVRTESKVESKEEEKGGVVQNLIRGLFFPFLFLLSPKHVPERRKTHMCFAKSFAGFCGEPQISISFAQQKLLKVTFLA